MTTFISTWERVILLTAAAALGCWMTAAAVMLAAPAHAVPGDPMPGCIYQMGSQMCDGPIRPDGTFKRCWQNPGYVVGGPGYIGGNGPMGGCEVVDPNNWPIIPIGAPHYHVD